MKTRANTLKYMVNLGHAALELKNFNGAMQVVAALGSAPVRRLKATFKQLSSKAHSRLEMLRSLLASSLNFSAYRSTLQLMADSEQPCVPYLGVMLQDLVFLDENATFVGDNSFNFDKIHRSWFILQPLLQFRNREYQIRPCPELQQHLVQLCSPQDEGGLFQLSLVSEPRISN